MRRVLALLLATSLASLGLALMPTPPVGASSTISPEAYTPPENVLFQWVTYGGAAGQEQFVAVGHDSFVQYATRIFTSPDGVTWTKRDVPTGHKHGGPIAYGAGKFVVFPMFPDQKGVLTSPDGITWTEHTDKVSPGYWRAMTFGGGVFVAVGATFTGITQYTKHVMTSTDGITWTDRTVTDGLQGDAWNSVIHDGTQFVSVGLYDASNDANDRGLVMRSPDGTTWTRATTVSQPYWNSVAHGDGRFVAVGPNGNQTTDKRYAMTSIDGETWTESVIIHKLSPDLTFSRFVAYGNNTFVAVTNDGGNGHRVIRYVKDGANWPDPTTSANGGWVADSTYPTEWRAQALTYGNETFVAVGSSNKIFHSKDQGITWTTSTVGAGTGGGTTDGGGTGGGTTGGGTTGGGTTGGGTTGGGTTSQLPSGQATATVDGQTVPVTVTSTTGGEVTIEGTDFSLSFNSPTSGDGNGLFLPQGGTATFTGEGYQSDTNVTSTITSTKTKKRLSRSRVSKSGTFSSTMSISQSVKSGLHRIQIDGTGKDGKARSIAVGVQVGKLSEITVQKFRMFSKKSKPRVKGQVRAINKQNPKATVAQCTGFIQPTSSKADVRLARKRAKVVCRTLKKQHAKRYKRTIKTTLSVTSTEDTMRRVVVSIR